jgi:hypothetical protein
MQTSSSLFFDIIIVINSQGSVGFDYVVTFNDTTGISHQIMQEELANVLNVTNNGAFLGDSDLQISTSTNRSQLENELIFEGKCDIMCIV